MNSGALDPESNMAWDEALLEGAVERGHPVFRSYGWNCACATFGYFQRVAEVVEWTNLRPLIRRPTGGGLVAHQGDWTYSVVLPPVHDWYQLAAAESYRRLHEWIQRAFAQAGVATVLAPDAIPDGPGRCFVGAERSDLLWNGQKLAGAAQRRNRLGLLIQGSIQPPPSGILRADWEGAMKSAATRQWSARWAPLAVSEPMVRRVKALAERKYATEEHRRRR